MLRNSKIWRLEAVIIASYGIIIVIIIVAIDMGKEMCLRNGDTKEGRKEDLQSIVERKEGTEGRKKINKCQHLKQWHTHKVLEVIYDISLRLSFLCRSSNIYL